jgi:hypothetical protein
LAAATAVVVFVVVLIPPPQTTTVQFAMLDSMGVMRGGTNDVTAKLVAALQENFGRTNFAAYSGNQELNRWLNQWPAGKAFKLVYDRDNAEVRIMSRVNGNSQVVKKFPVAKEEDLPTVLGEASKTIQQLDKAKP